MKPIQDKYPIFEANQVLSKTHLNEVVTYLDEQIRLTRANLIGIGIVCGVEFKLENTASAVVIHLLKGCGVSSEGYLLIQPEDTALTSYRSYTLPKEINYPQFQNNGALNQPQFPLWELFPAAEPNTTPLNSPIDFLDDKVLLLFLELKKEALRNCSPNECDDKGSEVTVTLRRLLIPSEHLDTIIAEANALAGTLDSLDRQSALAARMNLPDLRLPRYDTPNTPLVTSEQVLAGFHNVFTTGKLASAVGKALSDCYMAFKPLVEENYPTDPFAGFTTSFGFLESALVNTASVTFLQYYYDLFDDLIKGYDECLAKGAELICSCCPSEGLFPRHLMLGKLVVATGTDGSTYRHQFIPSVACGKCRGAASQFQQLFSRLVEMIKRFTPTPLPPLGPGSDIKKQIRITPSRFGQVNLSEKAIPYYYLLDGQPPLYHLWNPQKSGRNRPNLNLGYRSDEFNPAAPSFITDPLRHDLESQNFLRVEGHIGGQYQQVLDALLSLRSKYRLPFDVLALRTGAFDENQPVDLSKVSGEFRDLEALYDASREELLSALAEGVMNLYEIERKGSPLQAGTPQMPLLRKYAPNFRFNSNKVGAWYEKHFAALEGRPYIDVDQNAINANSVTLTVFCPLFAFASDLSAENYSHIVAIYYLSKLSQVLPASLDALEFSDFQNKYEDLLGLIRYFRSDLATQIPASLAHFIPQEELLDQFDQILYSCKLEPMRAIHDEYISRVREVQKRQFLSFFLQDHPGIQHKAGVPLGGTFILVYHHDSPTIGPKGEEKVEVLLNELEQGKTKKILNKFQKKEVENALSRLFSKGELRGDPDVQVLAGVFTGQVPESLPNPQPQPDIFSAAVKEMADGVVIADFFLPYLCCSKGSGVHFVLPLPPLGLLVEIDCTDAAGQSRATITPSGGNGLISYQLDNEAYKPLTGKVVLGAGQHSIKVRDSAGSESDVQTITVPDRLVLGEEVITDDREAGGYVVTFPISGGVGPYGADSGGVEEGTYTSGLIQTAQFSVVITDAKGCTATREITHEVPQPCTLPCGGKSRRCNFRLWLQPPEEGAIYREYKQADIGIKFEYENEVLPLMNDNQLLAMNPDDLNANFRDAMVELVGRLNKEISRALIKKYGEELGKERLVISFAPLATDPFSVLKIEYFTCEIFEINFEITLVKPTVSFNMRVSYTNKNLGPAAPFGGVTFTLLSQEPKEIVIPAFACSERDQCGDSIFTELCDGNKPKLTNKVTRVPNVETNLFDFKGGVTNMEPENISAWIWEASIGETSEPFYVGQEVQASFKNPGGFVKLTALTTKGCFGVSKRNIG